MVSMERAKALRPYTLLLLAVAPLSSVAETADELRGLWVCPWEVNSPAAVGRVVNGAANHNFNALFVEVRYRGDALYVPNKNDARFANPEPRSPHVAGRPADFDPLEDIINKGHAAGLEVHAWVTTYVVLNRKTPTPSGHPALEHPEWLSQNGRGETWDRYGMAWLEPALPEVQDYLYNVFGDIVANYDVDGLHLDYVRYPTPAFGRHPKAIELYQAETGKTLDDVQAFADWRRHNISAFVNRLYDGLAKLEPTCSLTAAVFASRKGTAYNDCLQDWTAWLEGGYVDAVIPMAYSRDPGTVGKQIEDAFGVASGRHIYAGIMVPEVAADEFDDAVGEEMVAKGRAAREAGAKGIVVFSSKGALREDALVARALREGLFGEPAAPPEMAWKGEVAVAAGPDVVAVYVKGEPKFAVRVDQDVPRRHAYLLAKEISARAGADVFIKAAPDLTYRVYAGAYDDRRAAVELRDKLARLGY
ncbi:MAG: family 10 glycosylhydrolase [bacterium]